MTSLATPRLEALARRARSVGAPGPARQPVTGGPADHAGLGAAAPCDLCGEPLGARHGHLVDVRAQALRCVCRACAILFDREAAGGHHYRLVPERVRLLEDFRITDLDWVALRIPVDLAFFFESSAAGRVVALYPGPMGATESLLELEHWERLVAENPVLAEMEPDVEALLVDRTGGNRDGWLVPIDACYELVGLIRTRWKGLAGGQEAWEAIRSFFEGLRRRTRLSQATHGSPAADDAEHAEERRTERRTQRQAGG